MDIFSFLRNVAYSKLKCHGRIFYIYYNINLLLQDILNEWTAKEEPIEAINPVR